MGKVHNAAAMPEVSFASLRGLLEEAGFTMRLVPRAHALFQAETPEHQILLRVSEPGEAVAPAMLVYVGHTLNAWGYMEREKFDERLRQLAVAG